MFLLYLVIVTYLQKKRLKQKQSYYVNYHTVLSRMKRYYFHIIDGISWDISTLNSYAIGLFPIEKMKMDKNFNHDIIFRFLINIELIGQTFDI